MFRRRETFLHPDGIQTLHGLIHTVVPITTSYPDSQVSTGLTETLDLLVKPTNNPKLLLIGQLRSYIYLHTTQDSQSQECNLPPAAYGAHTATLNKAHDEH
jgi:hypothetical protein